MYANLPMILLHFFLKEKGKLAEVDISASKDISSR
jgi:hypothetical protein